MPSALTGFKRALVSLLLEVARVYGSVLGLTRESPDDVVVRSHQKLFLEVHPDKPGGSVEHARRINDAWDAWNDARKKSRNIGAILREVRILQIFLCVCGPISPIMPSFLKS